MCRIDKTELAAAKNMVWQLVTAALARRCGSSRFDVSVYVRSTYPSQMRIKIIDKMLVFEARDFEESGVLGAHARVRRLRTDREVWDILGLEGVLDALKYYEDKLCFSPIDNITIDGVDIRGKLPTPEGRLI